MDPVADGDDEEDAAQALEESPVQVDVVLALVVKGEEGGEAGDEQKTGGDEAVEHLVDLVPLLWRRSGSR